MTPKVGSIFQNRFLILAELGEGGMGLVYRAQQLDAGREVALKLIRNEFLGRDTIDRFYREFRVLAGISHPNIMTIYGLALQNDSLPYAVCEYIEGRTLREVLAMEAPLPWRRVARIAIQICDAMQYAHEHNVIHRDLKPENIILLDTPEPDFVKIIDFGLARFCEMTEGSQKLTKTGNLIGSPHYMSPEQVKGEPSASSDIYALGCLIFELISKEPLFDAENPIAIINKHCKQDPSARLKVIEHRIPKRLAYLVEKALAKTTENRWQSMREISSELQLILEDNHDSEGVSRKKQLHFLVGIFLIIFGTVTLLVFKQVAFRRSKATANVSNFKLAEMHKKETEYRHTLERIENRCGIDSLKILPNLQDLAMCYEEEGKYTEEEALWRQGIAIREKAFGPNTRYVADYLQSLAYVYELQHKYAEEEALCKRTLAIRQKELAPNDPLIADTLQAMATSCRRQGRTVEAARFRKRAEEIMNNPAEPEERNFLLPE